MFFDDPKKNAQTILAKRKANGERLSSAPMKMEVVKTEEGDLDGRHVAAQDIIAAQHEGSAQKLMEALGHFVDMHQASPGSETPEK